MGCFPVSSRQMLMAPMVAITEKNHVIESVFLPEFASYAKEVALALLPSANYSLDLNGIIDCFLA